MGPGVEPRKVAEGAGWCVYRIGRSFRIQFQRDDSPDPVDIWLRRPPNDIARGALLGALVAGAYGAVHSAAATEAMQADW